ncbi:hypothetical protein [Halorubrum sp. SP9]|uniref:hypothetical protein n=1 Tax=Halorubrum sp. SP9 TaxID=1537267 RepID=UPI0010F4AB48|nr:hypothetical protein [Halorubrum sp. SP9]TKX69257.1 hypothetical protein EXE45_09060 [Halorubrum sp. SP9]
MDGIDEAIDELEELRASAEKMDGENEMAITDLFPPRFMTQYSEYEDFGEFIEDSPWTVESADDFEGIPEDEWDDYVRENTTFDGWENMQETAGSEWAKRQLGL